MNFLYYIAICLIIIGIIAILYIIIINIWHIIHNKYTYKDTYKNFYVNGYPYAIASESQESAEKYVSNLAYHKYIKLLYNHIKIKYDWYSIVSIPTKENNFTFKLNDGTVLSMNEFDYIQEFNEFIKEENITDTYDIAKVKYDIKKSLNDGSSYSIGYTPERGRIIYQLYLKNKNISFHILISNNKDLLLESDKKYFNI